jgi:LSD1 subclass zinc finger protein
MSVQLICPSLRCRKILSVPDEFRGKSVKCQYCHTLLRVPEAGDKKPASATAATTAAKATK